MSFRRAFARTLVAAALLSGLLAPPAARAQEPNSQQAEMANLYNAAMAAFNQGNWPAAIAGLEKVIAMVTEPKDQAKIGPIHYSLGAAYFNAKDYPKAIEALRTFLKKFPQDLKVNDARLAIARSSFLNKDYANAATLFAELEAIPAVRELSLEAQAQCYRELNQPDGEIKVLEKLIAPEIKNTAQANGATRLAQVYLEKPNLPKVLELVNKLFARIFLVDNVVALNSLTVTLGDQLAAAKEYPQALAAYRAVRSREEVLEFQKQRIAAMEKRIQANIDAAKANPASALALSGTNNAIKASMDQATELLGQFEKLPDYMPGLLFRMAKVWYESEKKWEAIVVFDRFLKRYPEGKDAEAALYSMLICYADMGRVATTQKVCQEYLKRYPEGPNAGTVGYLLGAVSLQANDPKQAASYFGTMLEKQPNSEFREQMRFGLGNAHFMQGEMEEARKAYQKYLTDFPTGPSAEEAQYREALTTIFLGEYEEAMKKFPAYEQKYPQGAFLADAGYRMMVCNYAASQYDEVIKEATAWNKKFPKDQISGEVNSILGDAYAAGDKTAEAAEAYIRSFKEATTDEVLNYTIFEAAKMLQKRGEWAKVASMFEDFVKEKPDHPTVVAAMTWISRAKAHEGKTEEAKTFLVDNLKRYINEPKREAVEQLLQQLVQLCLKRPRPATPPALAATPAPAPPAVAGVKGQPQIATPAPATPPPLPPWDPVPELTKQLAVLTDVVNTTGKARLLYAQAELARMRKKDAEADKLYAQLSEQFKIADLSPVLLAMVGDYQLRHGDKEKAAATFESLKEDYLKSDYLDFAYVGLGQLALEKKDFPKALELFTHAADELAATKIKDATMGKARALLELGQFPEAKKLFEQVAGVREWRGESTAAAVYYLGEVEARQKKWPEAIADYQRVFVAYQKFLPWVAKSYLRSAEAFDQLGKRTEAIAHLREMLRNEKLKELPETREAEKRLQEWGVASA